MITRSIALQAHARARAAACHAAAEAADHPADKAALRGAARLWERVAGPGVEWSTKPLRRDLTELKRDCALATGPFTQPQPPKAAPSVTDLPHPPVRDELRYTDGRTVKSEAIVF